MSQDIDMKRMMGEAKVVILLQFNIEQGIRY